MNRSKHRLFDTKKLDLETDKHKYHPLAKNTEIKLGDIRGFHLSHLILLSVFTFTTSFLLNTLTSIR